MKNRRFLSALMAIAMIVSCLPMTLATPLMASEGEEQVVPASIVINGGEDYVADYDTYYGATSHTFKFVVLDAAGNDITTEAYEGATFNYVRDGVSVITNYFTTTLVDGVINATVPDNRIGEGTLRVYFYHGDITLYDDVNIKYVRMSDDNLIENGDLETAPAEGDFTVTNDESGAATITYVGATETEDGYIRVDNIPESEKSVGVKINLGMALTPGKYQFSFSARHVGAGRATLKGIAGIESGNRQFGWNENCYAAFQTGKDINIGATWTRGAYTFEITEPTTLNWFHIYHGGTVSEASACYDNLPFEIDDICLVQVEEYEYTPTPASIEITCGEDYVADYDTYYGATSHTFKFIVLDAAGNDITTKVYEDATFNYVRDGVSVITNYFTTTLVDGVINATIPDNRIGEGTLRIYFYHGDITLYDDVNIKYVRMSEDNLIENGDLETAPAEGDFTVVNDTAGTANVEYVAATDSDDAYIHVDNVGADDKRIGVAYNTNLELTPGEYQLSFSVRHAGTKARRAMVGYLILDGADHPIAWNENCYAAFQTGKDINAGTTAWARAAYTFTVEEPTTLDAIKVQGYGTVDSITGDNEPFDVDDFCLVQVEEYEYTPTPASIVINGGEDYVADYDTYYGATSHNFKINVLDAKGNDVTTELYEGATYYFLFNGADNLTSYFTVTLEDGVINASIPDRRIQEGTLRIYFYHGDITLYDDVNIEYVRMSEDNLIENGDLETAPAEGDFTVVNDTAGTANVEYVAATDSDDAYIHVDNVGADDKRIGVAYNTNLELTPGEYQLSFSVRHAGTKARRAMVGYLILDGAEHPIAWNENCYAAFQTGKDINAGTTAWARAAYTFTVEEPTTLDAIKVQGYGTVDSITGDNEPFDVDDFCLVQVEEYEYTPTPASIVINGGEDYVADYDTYYGATSHNFKINVLDAKGNDVTTELYEGATYYFLFNGADNLTSYFTVTLEDGVINASIPDRRIQEGTLRIYFYHGDITLYDDVNIEYVRMSEDNLIENGDLETAPAEGDFTVTNDEAGTATITYVGATETEDGYIRVDNIPEAEKSVGVKINLGMALTPGKYQFSFSARHVGAGRATLKGIAGIESGNRQFGWNENCYAAFETGKDININTTWTRGAYTFEITEPTTLNWFHIYHGGTVSEAQACYDNLPFEIDDICLVQTVSYAASVDGTLYTTVEEAVAAATADSTVTLYTDVDTIDVSKGFILNVNNKTIASGLDYADAADIKLMNIGNLAVTVNGEAVRFAPAAPNTLVELASLKIASASLLLRDIIQIRYTVEVKTSAAETGLLVFASAEDAASHDFAKAIKTYDIVDGYAITDGIAAKDMGDSQFVVAYAMYDDGSYVFTDVIEYSPRAYAQRMVAKDDSSAELIAVCNAMMQYGAMAQIAMDYKTDALMNEGFAAVAYDESVLGESIFSVSTDVINGFKARSATLILEGAITYKMRYVVTGLEGKTLYAEYTTKGETKSVEMALEGSYYTALINGVAAKDMDEAVTVKPYYLDDNGDRVYGAELVYSGYEYARRQVASSTVKEATKNMAKALAMYIDAADTYLNTIND